MVGRVPSVRYGPRAVDLDILTYDNRLLDTRLSESRSSLESLVGELIIPHPRLGEREFVLRPLSESSLWHSDHMTTNQALLNSMTLHFVHPACNKTIQTLLNELVST